MVAGVLYGFYKFTGLQTTLRTAKDAAKEQTDRAKQDLHQAHEDLRNTYKQIGEMHKQQLENLVSMLNVNKTAESTELQRSHLDKLQEEIRNKLEEAGKARNDANRAKYQTSLEEKRKVQARNMVSESERPRRTKEGNYERRGSIEQRTKCIKEQKGKLIEMANSLVRSTD